MDAIGNSLGYAWILLAVAIVREIFGSGTINLEGLGFAKIQLFPEAFYEMGYMNNNLMILPPSALVVVGVIIWIQRSRNTALIEDH